MKDTKYLEIIKAPVITEKSENEKANGKYTFKVDPKANKLEIKEEETICIGDNINDLQMVKNAGIGIVMKNSALEKQNIEDFVTADNNSDGVGKAIYRYI